MHITGEIAAMHNKNPGLSMLQLSTTQGFIIIDNIVASLPFFGVRFRLAHPECGVWPDRTHKGWANMQCMGPIKSHPSYRVFWRKSQDHIFFEEKMQVKFSNVWTKITKMSTTWTTVDVVIVCRPEWTYESMPSSWEECRTDLSQGHHFLFKGSQRVETSLQ